jgi:hypothetical protein
MNPKRMKPVSMHAILAAALLALAACGGKPDDASGTAPPAPGAEAPAAAATPASPTPAPAPAPAPAVDATPTAAALQVADIEAYVRGMEKENAILQQDFDAIQRARSADDSDAETSALFHMTSSEIDQAGAQAAGMAPARYGFVKDRIDEVQSKLDMLEGFRKMGGDGSALEAQVGDPYAAFAADVAAALKAQQPRLAAFRAEAIGLRVKAAGG